MSAATMREVARTAREASHLLAQAPTAAKNQALAAMAQALERERGAIGAENAKDTAAARAAGLAPALVDRLVLDARRIEAMRESLRQIAALPDPIGELSDFTRRPNGLEVARMRLPLGVIAIIFESRPNVVCEAGALCVKSGNAVILRGGSEARHSNAVLIRLFREALAGAGLPADGLAAPPSADREHIGELLGLSEYIDLVIPRGGEALIRHVTEHSRIPVIQHYRGNCHVYVHGAADLAMAEAIIVNAKTQRPGVCNAAESMLVDRAVAPGFLPRAAAALGAKGVQIRGCTETCAILRDTRGVSIQPATEDDWYAEYLDLILAVRVVADFSEAVQHIARYGSQHTEAIVTQDYTAARQFVRRVQASAVMVNASTRFNDGFELGLGAEMGISTTRFHAFGPMGLNELTARKFVVLGDGQVRE